MPDIVVRDAVSGDRDMLRRRLIAVWGDPEIVVHGTRYRADTLPALIAEVRGRTVGTVSYRISADTLELVSLEACGELVDAVPPFRPVGRIGVGTALVETVSCRAPARVLVTTTNDNLDALRFYQRRGFRLIGLRPAAVEVSRVIKPSIPERGEYAIPIRDELDLERPAIRVR